VDEAESQEVIEGEEGSQDHGWRNHDWWGEQVIQKRDLENIQDNPID
jgi:hypothetical protein